VYGKLLYGKLLYGKLRDWTISTLNDASLNDASLDDTSLNDASLNDACAFPTVLLVLGGNGAKADGAPFCGHACIIRMPSASAGLSRNKDNAAASLGGDMDFPHISSVRFALEVEVGEPSALSHW